MPELAPLQALLIGFIVVPVIFALCAYFTRATPRRILAALVGASAYAVVNYLWDLAAASFGWWSYPGWSPDARFPLVGYALAGLVGGGAFGLVGWRVIRRWGATGLFALLASWSVYAIVHDFGGSALFAKSRLMVFGTGLAPVVADVLLYWALTVAPQAAIWAVAGPPRSGPLARSAGSELGSTA